jgi:ketosteroid isomerase-like protein
MWPVRARNGRSCCRLAKRQPETRYEAIATSNRRRWTPVTNCSSTRHSSSAPTGPGSGYAHGVSERNVQGHRRFIEAFDARDVEGLIASCHEKVEVHSVFAAVGGAVYNGHDGVRTWLRDIEEVWSEFRVVSEAYFDLGEYTIAFNVLNGRAQQSGVEVAMPYATVMRWRDDLIIYFKAYAHREDALRDLGVSGEGLEPIVP